MKLRREILAIAIPAIISNITTPVLGLVDVAITGHIGAAVYIGAIAVGGTLFNMLYWLFNFLRMGSSGPTAQAYGAGDMEKCRLMLWRSLTVAIAIGFLMLILSHPIASTALKFMDADDATQSLARQYFSICIFGAPAVMLTYALSGWFLGMQDSRTPMWMSFITNIVNIFISVTLVFGLGLKIEGVATGTCIAQWVGAIYGLAVVFSRHSPGKPEPGKVFEKKALLSFFRINSDIFLRTACLVAVTVWFTHAGALQGVDILAANALLLQLFMLFSFFMDGFAFAGEALAGKKKGMGDRTGLKRLTHALMLTGLAFAVFFSLVYACGGQWIMSLLAEDPSVVNLAGKYLPWAVAVPICGFMAFIWDGILVGLVRTRTMLAAMACALVVFFIMYFSLYHKYGNDALWMAFCSYLLVRGIAEWAAYSIFPHTKG